MSGHRALGFAGAVVVLIAVQCSHRSAPAAETAPSDAVRRLPSAFVGGSTRYYCENSATVGFARDEPSNQWVGAVFGDRESYSIIESEDGAYEIKVVGRDLYAGCYGDFDKRGFLDCEGVFMFKFNRISGRFIAAFPHGFYNVVPGMNELTDKTVDWPWMRIGTCKSP